MQFPRFRFTIRRMMITVAIVAFCLWGEQMRRMSSIYQAHAEFYHYLLTTPRNDPIPGNPSLAEQQVDRQAVAARDRRLIRYCEDLQAKYERAARYPWLPVAPDPPVTK